MNARFFLYDLNNGEEIAFFATEKVTFVYLMEMVCQRHLVLRQAKQIIWLHVDKVIICLLLVIIIHLSFDLSLV